MVNRQLVGRAVWRALGLFGIAACVAHGSTLVAQERVGRAPSPIVHMAVGIGFNALAIPCRPTYHVFEDGTRDLVPCARLAERRLSGVAARIGFTRAVAERLTAGVEALAWSGTRENRYALEERLQLGLHAVAHFFPVPNHLLYVKGGVGLGFMSVDTLDAGGASAASVGFLAGAGYHVGLSARWVLTPYVEIPVVWGFEGGHPTLVHMGVALGRREGTGQLR